MKRLLICDLDNTLYDWVGYFVPSFYAMVDKAEQIIGCERDVLLDDFRKVHQRHHDTEHPFALLETEVVKQRFPGMNRRDLGEVFDEAFHAFNTTRKKTLHLYPGVDQTLRSLTENGVSLVAHTEGKLYSVLDRLNRLGILHHFSKVYCRERSSIAHIREEVGKRWLESFPLEKVTELSLHQRKPSPSVLQEILQKEEMLPTQSVYVGDSIARDMMMAKMVGVKATWAEYGTHVSTRDYSALVRISHWTKEDVTRELELKEQSKNVQPDCILRHGFEQIISCFK
jgi:phosphoglycolate phosphatase